MVFAPVAPGRTSPTQSTTNVRDRGTSSDIQGFLSNAFQSIRDALFGGAASAQTPRMNPGSTDGFERTPSNRSLFPSSTPRTAPAATNGVGRSQANGSTYTVRSGDTLSKIAGRELGDANRWREIADLNNIANPDRINVGDRLRLPGAAQTPAPTNPEPTAPTNPEPTTPMNPDPAPEAPRTYTVRSGDSLSKIAGRELGDTNRWREIADLNNITNPNRINVGQVLQLPGGAPANPAEPANPTNPTPVGPVEGPGNGNTNAIQLSMEQLQQIVPSVDTKAVYNNGRFTGRYARRTQAEQQQVLDGLNGAMRELNITDREEAAMFVSQLAHESHGFRTFQEYASGRAYEGRRDLGNTQAGDGARFKGRGAIQLTGRANYTEASRALFPNDPDFLLRNPEAAEQLPLAFRVSSYYWQNRSGLRAAAQRGDVNRATRLINGGTNGLADRQRYYNRAIGIF